MSVIEGINRLLKRKYNMEYVVGNKKLIIHEPMKVKDLQKLLLYIKLNNADIKDVRVKGEK